VCGAVKSRVSRTRYRTACVRTWRRSVTAASRRWESSSTGSRKRTSMTSEQRRRLSLLSEQSNFSKDFSLHCQRPTAVIYCCVLVTMTSSYDWRRNCVFVIVRQCYKMPTVHCIRFNKNSTMYKRCNKGNDDYTEPVTLSQHWSWHTVHIWLHRALTHWAFQQAGGYLWTALAQKVVGRFLQNLCYR